MTKTWLNQYLLESNQTVFPGGVASQITYTYGTLGVVTNKSEYDYGQSTPARQTIYNYQPFSANPIGSYIYDRPYQVLVEDGSGNRVSEVDYLYDGGTPAGVSNLTNHDDVNFGTAYTSPRGDVTQKTQWSNTGTSPITTYTYDETGKTLSVTGSMNNLFDQTPVDRYGFVA
ncbi:MAG: hypothetical protein WBV36_19940 [Terriglobales bacterium]